MDESEERNVFVMPKRSLQSGSSLLALIKGGERESETDDQILEEQGERAKQGEEFEELGDVFHNHRESLGVSNTLNLSEREGYGSYSGRRVEEVQIESIDYNPHQTREIEEEADLAELAASIATKGVLQPVLVRPSVDGGQPFQLVAGERRLRAARLAGKSSVPAIVQEMTDQEAVEISIIENAQREDLNPIEEARAYRILVAQFGMNQGEVAEAIGKNRTTVANALRLLQLEESVVEMLENEELSAGHGRALLRVKDQKAQAALARKAARLGLSVRALEVLAARYEQSPLDEEEGGEDEETAQLNRLAERVGNFLGLERVLLKKDTQGRKRLQVVFETEASWKRFMSKIRD